jgi:hypothetical protein
LLQAGLCGAGTTVNNHSGAGKDILHLEGTLVQQSFDLLDFFVWLVTRVPSENVTLFSLYYASPLNPKSKTPLGLKWTCV